MHIVKILFSLQTTSQRHNDRDNKDDRLSNNNIKISSAPTPSQATPPASPQQATASRRLLEDALNRPGPYPMIVTPDKGYWIDGTDHECQYDSRGVPVFPHGSWRAKFETDDTAKCYRRFFVGRVSKVERTSLILNFELRVICRYFYVNFEYRLSKKPLRFLPSLFTQ